VDPDDGPGVAAMSQQEAPRGDRSSRIMRKALFTTLAGGVTYLITNLAVQPGIESITLSTFIGGVTLVVQFLIDFEGQLKAVERGMQAHATETRRLIDDNFGKINEATRLYDRIERSAASSEVIHFINSISDLTSDRPPLVRQLARNGIEQMSLNLWRLSTRSDVILKGEDQEYLLNLTASAAVSIDATCIAAVDVGVDGVSGGLWSSDLGQPYLDWQEEAVNRGVAIRRVFIVHGTNLADDDGLIDLLQQQQDKGIQVRVLEPVQAARFGTSARSDFVLFDHEVGYETNYNVFVGDEGPQTIQNTRLTQTDVPVLIRQFENLWKAASEPSPRPSTIGGDAANAASAA
jgi:hypothetical protein